MTHEGYLRSMLNNLSSLEGKKDFLNNEIRRRESLLSTVNKRIADMEELRTQYIDDIQSTRKKLDELS